jgi:hypothetical protein
MHTDRLQGDLISLLLFFQNKESRLKMKEGQLGTFLMCSEENTSYGSVQLHVLKTYQIL